MRQLRIGVLATAIVFALTACGGGSSSSVDVKDPTPTPTNTAPVANAGQTQNVKVGDLVTLNGGGSSDADNDSLTYVWAFTSVPSGSDVELSSSTVVSPTFTPDVDGTYTASLVVSDGTADSTAATVSIVAATNNSAPVANAGADQNVEVGTLITLTGAASSDADGDALTYSWAIDSAPAGSAATLSSATGASPTFTADVEGDFVVTLTVNDGTVDSESDSVTVSASESNVAPVANAGIQQNVMTGAEVTLDGSASTDANGDTLAYSWSFTSRPDGSAATLSNATTASPTFTADVDGTYTVQLIVNDGTVDSAASTVSVVAATENSAPVANAGSDQNIVQGNIVTLDGSASTDADGDGLTYQWAFVSKPADSTATLDDATAVNPAFTVDKLGSFVLSLVVNDGTVDSTADTVQIEGIEPRVRFFRKSITGSTYSEYPFGAIITNDSRNFSDPVPATTVLYYYKLKAEGQDFTITNLSATDARGIVTPYFNGLANGDVIEAGEEVEFSVESPLTGGAATELVYTFEIEETGQIYQGTFFFQSTTN